MPLKKVEGWDGNVLWLKVTEDEVKRNYERDAMPEPRRYFVKDYPTYTATYPELTTFVPRYTMSAYSVPRPEQPMFKCSLCDRAFRDRQEFERHQSSEHRDQQSI